jgi:hypothetical protein
VTNGIAAVSADQCGFRAFDLPFPGVRASKLTDAFDDLHHPFDMGLGQLPS